MKDLGDLVPTQEVRKRLNEALRCRKKYDALEQRSEISPVRGKLGIFHLLSQDAARGEAVRRGFWCLFGAGFFDDAEKFSLMPWILCCCDAIS